MRIGVPHQLSQIARTTRQHIIRRAGQVATLDDDETAVANFAHRLESRCKIECARSRLATDIFGDVHVADPFSGAPIAVGASSSVICI